MQLLLCVKYDKKKIKKIRCHTIKEIMKNDIIEIWVNTRIATNITVVYNKPIYPDFEHKEKRDNYG